jgi:hypothetical protein
VVWCCGGAGREGAKEKMASASKRTEGEKLAWVGGGDLKKKGGGGGGTTDGVGVALPFRMAERESESLFLEAAGGGAAAAGPGVDMRWVVSRRW